MDKAQALLEKMGWKKGMGLGKNNDGIKDYIGVVKKTDTAGIGVDKFKWDDMWWDNIYKKASKNVNVGSEGSQPPIVEVPKPKENVPLKYGKFTKTAVESESSSSSSEDEIADGDLFAKCEGRMLRKYVPEGKLRRLAAQNTNYSTGNMDTDISANKSTPFDPAVLKAAKENGKTSNKRKKVDSDSDSDDESEAEAKKKANGKSKKNKKAKKTTKSQKKKGKDTDSDSSSSEEDSDSDSSSSSDAISSGSDSDDKKKKAKKRKSAKKSKKQKRKEVSSSEESDSSSSDDSSSSSSSSSEEESTRKKKKDKKK